jgi:hypothetical protein
MPKSKHKVSPRRKTLKRKRENSAEIRRQEASEERRRRLSSQEANRRFFNKLFNGLPRTRYAPSSKQENLNRLNKELTKNKHESMNLLSNRKRKFTFKGLGKRLGTKI